MADNIQVTAGSGTTVAADDIGGVLFQRVKLGLGADGSSVDAIAGAGNVSTAVQRVTVATDDANLAAINTATAGAATSLAVLDDWDESDRAKVNLISGQAGVAGGSGTVGATTQRVVLATDVALPAGTNAIGKLSANSGVDIGDVDVTTINGVAPAFGSGVNGATVQRVTVATDDTLVASLATKLDTLDTTVGDGNIVQVAHDAADSGGGAPIKIGGYASTAAPSAVSADGDRVNAWYTLNGAQVATIVPHTVGGLSIFRSLDLDETEEEVKATAGQLYKLRITNFATSPRYVKIYNATAANVTVGTTVSPTLVDTIPVPAGSSTAPTVITESYGAHGVALSTAITLAATTGLADSDTGAPSANDVVVSAYYK